MTIMTKFAMGIFFPFISSAVVVASASAAAAANLSCAFIFAPTPQRAPSTLAYEILEFQIRPELESLRKQSPERSLEVAPHTLEMMAMIVERARQVPKINDWRVVGTGENFSHVDVSKWIELSYRVATDGNHDGLLSPALALYTLSGLLPQEDGGSYVTAWNGSDEFIKHVSMEFLLPRLKADSDAAIAIVRTREARRRLDILDGLLAGLVHHAPLTEEMRHVRDYFIRHEFYGLRKLNDLLLQRLKTAATGKEPEDSTGGLGWALSSYDDEHRASPNPFFKFDFEMKKLGYTDKSIAALKEMKTILERQKLIGKSPQWIKWNSFRGHDISYGVDSYYWR